MHNAGIGLRDALKYSGSSWTTYYYKEKPRFVAPDPLIVKSVKRLMLESLLNETMRTEVCRCRGPNRLGYLSQI